ncbi:DNA-binding XRE family transcriptional regulator [Tenacibaculum sp. 190524A02b]|uniref:DNA-binding XRE family transcriptional regulator n=1 Tax=Tenacibaculum vairaonense TaxID=3137860 RepID=A0ABM9PM77_9FLAO
MRIKKLRAKNKETQSDLAELLGVSLRTVQNYEKGSVTIPNEKLKLLAKHYSISVSEIFLDKDEIVTDLDSVDKSLISDYIVRNWDDMMKDNLFAANFKAKAGEWAISIKKSENSK